MNLERRRFGAILASLIALPWCVRALLASQEPPDPASQAHPPDRVIAPEGRPDRSPEALRIALQENQNQIKKNVQRLYELATELKNEVEKTDSSKILSLNLVKKAEEAEKLAKQIKTLART